MKLRDKKILKITESYFPNDVRVLKEAIAYQTAGANVFVLAMNDGNQKSFEVYLNIRVYRIPLSMKKGRWLGYLLEYLLFFLYSLYYVYKLNKKNRFDIVHVHTIPDFLVFASLPAKITGAKIILDLAELMPEFYSFKFNVGMNNLVVKIAIKLEYLSMHYADQCITISERIKKIFKARTGIKDIAIIMNTIEPINIKPSKNQNKGNQFSIIYHGHINAAYDFESCIKAVNLIKENIPNFLFKIYGDGPNLNKLKKYVHELNIEDNVVFYGWVDRSIVYEAIVNSNIGIIPARNNHYLNLSFSNKLGDFVALGVPVIAPKLVSYLDYFPLDSLAYIDKINEHQIYKKVINLYNERGQLNELSKTAFSYYSKINWRVMDDRLISLVINI